VKTEKKQSWIELIKKVFSLMKYISGFFSKRKEEDKLKEIRRHEGMSSELDEEYKEIDNKKEKKKSKDLEKRLNNIF